MDVCPKHVNDCGVSMTIELILVIGLFAVSILLVVFHMFSEKDIELTSKEADESLKQKYESFLGKYSKLISIFMYCFYTFVAVFIAYKVFL